MQNSISDGKMKLLICHLGKSEKMQKQYPYGSWANQENMCIEL